MTDLFHFGFASFKISRSPAHLRQRLGQTKVWQVGFCLNRPLMQLRGQMSHWYFLCTSRTLKASVALWKVFYWRLDVAVADMYISGFPVHLGSLCDDFHCKSSRVTLPGRYCDFRRHFQTEGQKASISLHIASTLTQMK